MEPFRRLTAVAAPLDAVNVDTDQIIPARFIKYPRSGAAGYGSFLFHDLRFDETGQDRPDFILNREPFRGARIIVGNANFGSGSSREGAVYALLDHGVRAVIAPSFGDIFFNNCLKNGIVPAQLADGTCADLRTRLHSAPGSQVSVDLEQLIVWDGGGAPHPFVIDEFRRALLLEGSDEIGLTLGMQREISLVVQQYSARYPWLSKVTQTSHDRSGPVLRSGAVVSGT